MTQVKLDEQQWLPFSRLINGDVLLVDGSHLLVTQKKKPDKKNPSAVASATQSTKEKEAVISPLSPLLSLAPPLPSLAPFINTFQASDWSVIDNHASHIRVSAFIPALLYIPSCLTWADSRRRSRRRRHRHTTPPPSIPLPSPYHLPP